MSLAAWVPTLWRVTPEKVAACYEPSNLRINKSVPFFVGCRLGRGGLLVAWVTTFVEGYAGEHDRTLGLGHPMDT